MNEHEQRPRPFIYVPEHSITCSLMFDCSLVFFSFMFCLNNSKSRPIKYLISVRVLYILFMNACLCSFVSICVH
ncbi:hypothetical protein HanIR_Chr08g0365921 [Helianthus annuus]|nr:hypothetical protein HanIR_Chr08g0365921 [Helianthus annuus]